MAITIGGVSALEVGDTKSRCFRFRFLLSFAVLRTSRLARLGAVKYTSSYVFN